MGATHLGPKVYLMLKLSPRELEAVSAEIRDLKRQAEEKAETHSRLKPFLYLN